MQELLSSNFSGFVSVAVAPLGFLLSVYSIIAVLSQDFFAGEEKPLPFSTSPRKRFVFHYNGPKASRFRFLIRLLAKCIFLFLFVVTVLLVSHVSKFITLLPTLNVTLVHVQNFLNIVCLVILILIAYAVYLSVLVRSRIPD